MAAAGWDAEAYERSFARLCAGAVEPLLDALEASTPGRLLDLGTGTGQVAAAARRRGWAVAGVDADPGMVEHARRVLPDAEIVRGTADALPWPDAAFDAVTAGFVVNHVPDPAAALAEVERVLRPAGRIAMTIWPAAPGALNGFWNDVVAVSGVRAPAPRRLPADLDFERSSGGVTGLLAAVGFRDVAVREVAWTFAIEPDALWLAVASRLATIGAVFAAQPADGRERLRGAFERLARQRSVGGVLHFPSLAVLGSATR